LEATRALQRIGYILDKLASMDEIAKELIMNAIKNHLATQDCTFIPLDPKLPQTSYPRNKNWKIIENTTFESDI
jgi:hypothetical protein